MTDFQKGIIIGFTTFVFGIFFTLYLYFLNSILLYLLIVFGLLYIFFLICFWSESSKKAIWGRIFLTISVVIFLAIALTFFIGVQNKYFDHLINLDARYRVIILIITWATIYHLLINKILSINSLQALFKRGADKTDNWKALTTNKLQGADVKEINLKGKLLQELNFKITPKSKYWRAGFKITTPNGVSLPLLSSHSILIHVGSNDGKNVGITTYHFEGDLTTKVHKDDIVADTKSGDEIKISVTINEKNFLQCLIDGRLQFESRIDSSLRKKLFLLAWGDGNNYEVDFRDILYKTT